jgi:hypothetical protein
MAAPACARHNLPRRREQDMSGVFVQFTSIDRPMLLVNTDSGQAKVQ